MLPRNIAADLPMCPLRSTLLAVSAGAAPTDAAHSDPNGLSGSQSQEGALPGSGVFFVAPHFKVPALGWPKVPAVVRRFTERLKNGAPSTETPAEPAAMAMKSLETTDDAAALLHSGFAMVGEDLQWRGVLENFGAQHDALVALVDEMMAGPGARVHRFEISGPRGMAFTVVDPSLALQADYFEQAEGFFSRLAPNVLPGPTACSVEEHFVVKDWKRTEPIMESFLDRTRGQEGCLYSGWSKKGDALVWRESFVDGDAVRAHFEAVGPWIDALLAGPAVLTRAEVHGPAAELDKARLIEGAIAANFKPEFIALTHGDDLFADAALTQSRHLGGGEGESSTGPSSTDQTQAEL